jgi:CheY-like chemotaxis protein
VSTLHRKRVFAVEDNLDNRVITQMALTLHGVLIEFDRWGRDTVSKVRNFMPVDVIILDLMFPNGVTGYDIFDLIRAEPAFAHIPIVAVSASDPSSAIPRCKARGFAGFIPKPIDSDVFAAQLEQIIAGHEIWLAQMA